MAAPTQLQPLNTDDIQEQGEMLDHFSKGASWAIAMGLCCVEEENVTRWLRLGKQRGADAETCRTWLLHCKRTFAAHLANEYDGMREIYRLRAIVHATKAQSLWLTELAELQG